MSDWTDKAKHKAEELKGEVKERVGDWTGNERMQDEGVAEQTRARAKQVGDDVSDAVRDARDAVKRR